MWRGYNLRMTLDEIRAEFERLSALPMIGPEEVRKAVLLAGRVQSQGFSPKVVGLNPKAFGLTARQAVEAGRWSGPHKPTRQERREIRAKERARRKPPRVKPEKAIPAAEFFSSDRWLALRYHVFKRDGAKCRLCNATRQDGVRLHVDHIKPRSRFPEMQWDPNNLQVLCEHCNKGKLDTDFTDWR
jgi:hypothetical protein